MGTESENTISVAVIGAGNVGVAFANMLQCKGHKVSLVSRDPVQLKKKLITNMPQRSFAFNINGLGHDLNYELNQAELILLAVPDDAIQNTCNTIAQRLRPNCIVAHLSGALDSSALATAKTRGIHCCSLHPLNSFPDLESSVALLQAKHGSYLYCEGEEQALKVTDPLFEQCGFMPVRIDATAKPLYHAASVFACNYLSVLMDASLQTGAAANIDKQILWRALQPLIQTTLNNIDEQGPAESLSGPIARGDSATVSKHQQALVDTSPALAELYAALGKYAIDLAEQRGSIDQKIIEKMNKALRQ